MAMVSAEQKTEEGWPFPFSPDLVSTSRGTKIVRNFGFGSNMSKVGWFVRVVCDTL